MTVVLDASVVVAAAIDEQDVGPWARSMLDGELVAPVHWLMEAVGAVRRALLCDRISEDVASLATADLTRLPVRTVPLVGLVPRVWQLRRTVSAADACYVAVAEGLGAPLVTLDHRLSRASGPRCAFLTPTP